MEQAFNPSVWEAETGGFLSSRPAWSTEKPCLEKTKKKKVSKEAEVYMNTFFFNWHDLGRDRMTWFLLLGQG